MGVRFKSVIAMARKFETATLYYYCFTFLAMYVCSSTSENLSIQYIFLLVPITKRQIISLHKIAVILKFQSLELKSSILFSIWVYLVHSKLIVLCLFFISYLLDQFDIQDESKNFIDHSNHKNANDNRYDDNH